MKNISKSKKFKSNNFLKISSSWILIFGAISVVSFGLLRLFRQAEDKPLLPSNELNETEITLFSQTFNSEIIAIDESCKHFITQFGSSFLFPFKSKLIEAIYNTVVTAEFKAVFEQDPAENFKVNIRCGPSRNSGSYDSDTNQLYITFEPEAEIDYLSRCLTNELHHASIRRRNKQLGSTARGIRLGEPFDQKRAENFINAVDAAESNVMIFYNLHKQIQTGFLNQNSKKNYDNYRQALKEYSPEEYIDVIPIMDFKTAVEPFLIKNLNPEIPYYIPSALVDLTVQPPANLYYMSIKREGNYFVCRSRFAENPNQIKDKVNAFISDFFRKTNNIKKGYDHKLSRASLAAETLSFMEEFPSSIKMTFFGESCKFLGNFFNRSDYCKHSDRFTFK